MSNRTLLKVLLIGMFAVGCLMLTSAASIVVGQEDTSTLRLDVIVLLVGGAGLFFVSVLLYLAFFMTADDDNG